MTAMMMMMRASPEAIFCAHSGPDGHHPGILLLLLTYLQNLKFPVQSQLPTSYLPPPTIITPLHSQMTMAFFSPIGLLDWQVQGGSSRYRNSQSNFPSKT